MTDELLPCPFCGGEAQEYATMGTAEFAPYSSERDTKWCVSCRDCDCTKGESLDYTEEEAIKSWNTRKEPK